MSNSRARMSADNQALALVEAMREVGRKLERRRTALTAAHSAHQRDSLRSALLADLDRLTNLVSLATSLSHTELRAETVEILESAVESLRDRMRHIGTEVAMERLQELHISARDWSRGGAHPLGKSLTLREEFMRNVTYLRSMTTSLTGANREMLADTVDTINSLIHHDRDSSWLRSFSDDPPLSLIDPKVAEFDEVAEGDGGR